MLLRLISYSLLLVCARASFCGDSSIPFSLEVLGDGQPVLGCARPVCFGWAPDGRAATGTSQFERINDHTDGFVRSARESIPVFGPEDPRFASPQIAVCDKTYAASKCSRQDQWVGGIAPLGNVTMAPTGLRCCSYAELVRSQERGLAPLRGGQTYVGGEVISGGKLIAFDYISDVAKVVEQDGTLQYQLSIRRMPCADLPDSNGKSAGEPSAFSDNRITDRAAPVHAFQAPSMAVNQPLSPPSNSFQASANAVDLTSPSNGPPAFQAPTNVVDQPLQPPPAQQQSLNELFLKAMPVNTFQQAPQYQPNLQAPPAQMQPVGCQAQQATGIYTSQPAFGCGGFPSQLCFTADMTVEVLGAGTKRMDELKKDDWVLAAGDKWLMHVPVEYWLHRVPNQEAVFNVFETEDGKEIKLTDKHYIFKGDCSRVTDPHVSYASLPKQAVAADQIHAGDCLFTLGKYKEMHEVRVVRASKITETGIYAPMTSSGRIIVNGIHASCHNIMQEHTTTMALFKHVEMFNSLYERIFGADSSNDVIETPLGLSTVLAMAELFMPESFM
ncbi:hypothetical protein PRIPAC_91630 [Pristionchus pacificus]|uniref:Uncharacterized protein n=1 Tax=Pristionchus pacificus TaxID=54126 RepID=A0A2A6CD02_PRIPA|nr:hypothetical protein PRIPAC_91630 [Pristionchus pacificus]|eukprot:PDM75978.1 hypothetical protein PRIPAC_39582 [Pristionchus pacificus]